MTKQATPRHDTAIQYKQMENMDDVIFIDTGSSVNTFRNQLLLGRIRVSNQPILMQTNVGSTRIDLEGDFLGLGVVYWDKDLRVNIACFADLILWYRITYDSTVKDACYVHTDKGIIKFVRYGKLYGYRVSENSLNAMAKLEGYKRPTKQPTTEASHAVPAMADNRKGFTDRQFKDARAARDLQAMLGFPATKNFKHHPTEPNQELSRHFERHCKCRENIWWQYCFPQR